MTTSYNYGILQLYPCYVLTTAYRCISDMRFRLTKEKELGGGAIRFGFSCDVRNDLKATPVVDSIDVSSSFTMYAIVGG